MLWYYTRDILRDPEPELLAGLQEKACLAQESTGWEYAVIGLLDVNVYIRLVTVGLQVAILPRGETLCAHTVTQPPGSVFLLPNMMEDWRFRESPYVEQGGLTAYAGVPLRMLHESGEAVGLGSLCVASATSQEPLTQPQQQTLARLGDWIVSDIVQYARARRQRERSRLSELIAEVEKNAEDTEAEEPVLQILRKAYPDAAISLQSSQADRIETEARRPISSSDLENGLWEDTAYIDEFIAGSNQQDPPTEKVVRFVAFHCETTLGPSLLVVATKDFRMIFDDVDYWFVQTCANMLSQRWQKRLLSEVMKTKEKFLRGISHQLRTPIHGILGAAELLTEDLKMFNLENKSAGLDLERLDSLDAVVDPVELLKSVKKSAVYLETIMAAGRDLMSTVNSMITLNRWADIAVSDRQVAVHTITDIENALVESIAREITNHTGDKSSIFINFHLPSGHDSLRIDLNLFRDTLLPLIINAIQNTSEGTITVTISMDPDGKDLVVDVEDTGCGIHPRDRKRIFELYEKVGEHSTAAGLGLTLATKFATLLDGSVELVSSEVDQGSHFRATFRDIDSLRSTNPPHPVLSKLKSIPSKFYHMTSGSASNPLSMYLNEFLLRNGFTSSEAPDDCLLVLDFISDHEERQKYLSTIPPNQVALCLVPASEDNSILETTFDNIIYLTGPFLTSTLTLALEEADKRVAAMKAMSKDSVPLDSSILSPGTTEEGATSDEGYGSASTLPSPDDVSNRTIADVTEATSDILTPSIHPADAIASPDSGIGSPVSMAASSQTKPRALVVDDNAVNLRILQMYCSKRGLPYCCATNGQEAIDIFTEHQALSASGQTPPIELILMDLQMPVCDGVEATQKIRQLEKRNKWKASSLFIVSGQDSKKDRALADGAGADEYLVKPVSMKVLDSELKRYFPAFEAK